MCSGRFIVKDDILQQLITMSNNLGKPELDFAILGEGNTSAGADNDTFWVKASGFELRTITAQGFTRVSRKKVLSILDQSNVTDEDVKQCLRDARLDDLAGHPSVETVLHAICLGLDGVNFVGHTHPTAINSITCSAAFFPALRGSLFPDQIVVCGPAPVVVPYVDPGVPLARKVLELVEAYLDEYRETPKVILLQNHGIFALGRTAQQVENITSMAVKAARVLLGTYALGGPSFLSPQAVSRIHTRPDELLRRTLIGE